MPLCGPSIYVEAGCELLRLEQAVLERSALVESIAVGPILGDADRAWVEAEDVRVAWGRLVDLLVRVPIDKCRTLGEFWQMVN